MSCRNITSLCDLPSLPSHHIARVVSKLDADTGAIIWSATLPINDHLGTERSSAYESIVFTSDGGFVVSGVANYPFEGSATEGPMFKSAGQIEEGNPLIEKYPPSVANADQVNANEFILGKFSAKLTYQIFFIFLSHIFSFTYNLPNIE